MHQLPWEIWNQVAASQPLNPFWREVMAAPPEEMEAAVARVDALAQRSTQDNRVILAHRLVAPLLVENEAISGFLMETQQGALRASLPEVISMNEAISLASMEYRLEPRQAAQLRRALRGTLAATKP